MIDSKMYWHNFKTGEDDYRDVPATDEEAKQYIPQSAAAQNLYDLYRHEDFKNYDVLEAMGAVLAASVGEPFEPRKADKPWWKFWEKMPELT